MRAIEHVYPDGNSSFEITEATHGEMKALKKLMGEEHVAWIRANCSIDYVHTVEPRPEPDDDETVIFRPLRGF